MSTGLSDAAWAPEPRDYAIFFLLKAGEPEQWLRAWSGFGEIDIAADAFDTTGGRYASLPFPDGIPPLPLALNGAFASIEFSLNGVPAEVAALAGVDRHLVEGARVHLGVADLGGDLQPIGGVDWLMQAQAAKPRVSRIGRMPTALHTITLPATLGFKDRALAPVAYLTAQGQRARSGDDAFCDLTAQYAANSTVKWPG